MNLVAQRNDLRIPDPLIAVFGFARGAVRASDFEDVDLTALVARRGEAWREVAARRGIRFGVHGAQDVRSRVDEAIGLLTPLVREPSAPYLLQALIAAEHAIARTAADTDWARISRHYAELEDLTGSPVVRLNRAVAVAEADGPLAGLALLEGLDLPGHRLPGVRGELLARAGRTAEAAAALTEALALCENDAERRHLEERLISLRRRRG